MGLREELDTVLASEPLDRVSMERGARLALESQACRQEEEFGKPCVLVIGPCSMCDRCVALASLTPQDDRGVG
jgi:hypothetical protein